MTAGVPPSSAEATHHQQQQYPATPEFATTFGIHTGYVPQPAATQCTTHSPYAPHPTYSSPYLPPTAPNTLTTGYTSIGPYTTYLPPPVPTPPLSIPPPSSVPYIYPVTSTPSANPSSIPPSSNPLLADPPCCHNSWDNVRVIKGQITLRCRVCQSQWRTPIDAAWRKRKCAAFGGPIGCARGDRCSKLHLHSRKQSLKERFELHGDLVLASVPSEVLPADISARLPEDSTREQRPLVAPCSHNSWDKVRVKKQLVTLRCRECQSQWRHPVDTLSRCEAFQTEDGCKLGEACPSLHLHQHKQTLGERASARADRN